MNTIINYFSNVPDFHRIILLSLSIFILWNIENLNRLSSDYKKWKHSLINLKFVFLAAPIQLFLGFFLNSILNWTDKNDFGLLHVNSFFLNPLALFLTSFLVLDFFEYVYHLIMHKVRRFWMFHLVHHSDRNVDVTTVLREHPGETFIRLCFLCIFVFVLGVPFWALLFRQFIQIFSNAFSHANFKLPEKVNNIVGIVFITPNIHLVHHHTTQPYTDSNYGDVLSIWDRLFGTFKKLDTKMINFGIDTYPDRKENEDFRNLMKIPFKEYRPPQPLNE